MHILFLSTLFERAWENAAQGLGNSAPTVGG